MMIGNIIRVDDAVTYIAKIPPDAHKERVGRLVKITKKDEIIVGVIRNIVHSVKEELIPYIEPEMQPKYAPFNEDFRNSYYIIHGLGRIIDKEVRYDIDSPPDIGDKVDVLTPDEIKKFHTINNKPSIAYFHTNKELGRNILMSITNQVEEQYPECKSMLKLVRKYLERV